MRIACILPTSRSRFRHRGVADYVHMSGLNNIAGYLKHQNHEVCIFDYLVDEGANRDILDRQLVDFRPNMFVICAMFCLEDVTEFLSTAPCLKPKPYTVCVGTGALDYRVCLRGSTLLDFVVPVDPETVISDLAVALQTCVPIENIPGFAYRSNGKIRFTKRTATSLDHILDNQDVSLSISAESLSFAYLWGSRGCWYRKCTFCTIGAASKLCKGQGWVPRDIELIVNDIKILYNKGVRHIHFLDAEFIGPGTEGQLRAQSFAKEMIHADLHIQFFIDARVDSLQDETIRLLKEAGLSSVFVGIESCSQSILDRLCKGFNLADIKRGIRVLRRWRVPFKIGWLLADPESTLEDVRDSISMFRRLRLFDGLSVSKIDDPTGVGSVFHEFHFHAGTPIYDYVAAHYNRSMPSKSEIPCTYRDGRIVELLEQSKPFRREIALRYRWLKKITRHKNNEVPSNHWQKKDWQKRYEYALGILAFIGLEKLIEEFLVVRLPHSMYKSKTNSLEFLLHKHDNYWFGNKFDEISNSLIGGIEKEKGE